MPNSGAFRRRSFCCCHFALWLTAVVACKPQQPTTSKSAPPVEVDKVAQEDQLNTVRLSVSAEQRLGVETAKVEARSVPRYRTYGGEITLPTGAMLVVSAPVGGTLLSPGAKVPQIGETLAAKQPLFHLLPLLSPERAVLTPAERVRFAEAKNTVAQSQIDAAGQVEQAQVQVDAAKIALERAERLLREQAGTARAVDDARAQVELAEKTLEAAKSRKQLVDGIKLDEEPGKLTPIVIEAPRRGVLRTQHAVVGEVVTAGAPLFEIIDTDTVWVRVSVYAGEAKELIGDAPALVSDLADRHGTQQRQAAPINAPPTAVPLAAAIDLYYTLANPETSLKPGERVTARLQLRGEQSASVIPWSAVVQDIHGGEWIYEASAPQTYIRRRIQVQAVVDGLVILAHGPSLGTPIVTAGAIELFGAEFGFAK